jgi:hypothetical protein
MRLDGGVAVPSVPGAPGSNPASRPGTAAVRTHERPLPSATLVMAIPSSGSAAEATQSQPATNPEVAPAVTPLVVERRKASRRTKKNERKASSKDERRTKRERRAPSKSEAPRPPEDGPSGEKTPAASVGKKSQKGDT